MVQAIRRDLEAKTLHWEQEFWPWLSFCTFSTLLIGIPTAIRAYVSGAMEERLATLEVLNGTVLLQAAVAKKCCWILQILLLDPLVASRSRLGRSPSIFRHEPCLIPAITLTLEGADSQRIQPAYHPDHPIIRTAPVRKPDLDILQTQSHLIGQTL